jgi:hypothetical protein
VLRRPANVAWAAYGARTYIDTTAEAGVAWLVITREGTPVVTTRIETPRLAEEKLPDPSLEWTVLGWQDDLAAAVPTGERVGVDGTPTGFLARDHLATPGSVEPVELGRAFAWNPSVPWLKVEDTVLAGPDGVEVLTVDDAWPTRQVAGRARPAVMQRD